MNAIVDTEEACSERLKTKTGEFKMAHKNFRKSITASFPPLPAKTEPSKT